jgi:transcriptional regulator with XRE-family HTH domain
MTRTAVPPFGRQLRRWRGVRRLSQLDLSLRSGIAPRHLSFIETGRSRPGKEVVLRLADALALPLREQNDLLRVAGFAPAWPESGLSSEEQQGDRPWASPPP